MLKAPHNAQPAARPGGTYRRITGAYQHRRRRLGLEQDPARRSVTDPFGSSTAPHILERFAARRSADTERWMKACVVGILERVLSVGVSRKGTQMTSGRWPESPPVQPTPPIATRSPSRARR